MSAACSSFLCGMCGALVAMLAMRHFGARFGRGEILADVSAGLLGMVAIVLSRGVMLRGMPVADGVMFNSAEFIGYMVGVLILGIRIERGAP